VLGLQLRWQAVRRHRTGTRGEAEGHFSRRLSERSTIVTDNLILFCDGVSQGTGKEYWIATLLISYNTF